MGKQTKPSTVTTGNKSYLRILRVSFFCAMLQPDTMPLEKSQPPIGKRFKRLYASDDVSYLVSSAISISGCAVMGVCEWPAGSSPPKSPLVEETTWTEPWRSAGVNVPPSRFPPGPPDVPADAADALTPSAQPVLAAPVGC